jgi:ElaB/YqjD/DUF883 family membrane-anchored ribosome-binding protein
MATINDPLTSGMQNEGASNQSNGGVKAKLSDATSHVKHTAADFGRSAQQNIDRNLQNAAGALERSATALRSKLPAEGGKITGVAQTAVDKMDATARYLRTHNTQDFVSTFETWARRNPGAALGGAMAIGLVLGMSLNRDRHHD